VALSVVAAPAVVAADPLRLRGDVLATVESPTGLVTLEAEDRVRPWLDAEALVWFGAGADAGAEADALVVVVRLRDPRRRGSLRLGRQVVVAGALRPVHVDGVAARAHLPRRVDVELFAGLPVVPGFGPRPYDWLIGGRVSRPIGAARLGLAWIERRDHGALHTHEIAGDAAWPVSKNVDFAAGLVWDLIGTGLAAVNMSAAARHGDLRVELFGQHRSPSHLLPATSLFSVLGDVPAWRAGATVRWRAAPRLDVGGTAGVRVAGDELAEDLVANCRLRLDDRGTSSVGVELRRQGAPDHAGWIGVRGTARLAIAARWTASTELELVVPDADTPTRGAAWPWALGAITWRPAARWELAAATEASASPEHRWRIDALLRLSRTWETR
jgi:hypothetical protein